MGAANTALNPINQLGVGPGVTNQGRVPPDPSVTGVVKVGVAEVPGKKKRAKKLPPQSAGAVAKKQSTPAPQGKPGNPLDVMLGVGVGKPNRQNSK